MTKKKVLVLFGGQSSEHEISCISATTIINNMDKKNYDIIPVGITKEGEWLLFEGEIDLITKGDWEKSSKKAILSPDATEKCLIVFDNKDIKKIKIDLVFPALHGMYGEDGTIQGLFELAQIPYVGCGVLASSIAMDKLYTKTVVNNLNIRQAKHALIYKEQLNNIKDSIIEIENVLDYPMFIKPCNAGSSVGITKAHNQDELIEGLKKASEHDRKILIEETIIGREIECAVLGGVVIKASSVGEIVSVAEFYDYDSKYNSVESKTIISPDLPKECINTIRKYSVDIFKAIGGYGLSRVDFFLEEGTNEIVFNEINTMPGFTSISMYPMLWEDRGVSISELIDKLIQLALKRYQY